MILTLGAQPDITDNPTDTVLILDRSGSMAGSLPALKNAANVVASAAKAAGVTIYVICTLMTIAEVRRFLNISQSAAYQFSRRKDFPVCRFGGNIRVPRDAFLACVDARTYIPTALA